MIRSTSRWKRCSTCMVSDPKSASLRRGSVGFTFQTQKEIDMATKVETRQKDIECRLNMRELVELEGRANHLMKSAIDRSIASGLDPRYDTVKRYVEDRIAAGIKANAASLSYHKIPKERQEWLAEAGKKCNDLSYVISGMLPILSGDREVHVSLGKSRSVFCGTSPGDKYSKSCKYTKKDGRVHMKLTAEDLVGLMDPANCDIQRLSQADGLPLISVERMTDGVHSCRWVKKSRGFSVEVVSGWIASYRSTCFHSTKSWGHALSGLTRKLKGCACHHSLIQSR